MADSDNSTALSSVTRRRLMAAVTRSRPPDVSTPQSPSSETSHEDQILRLCEEWQEAHDHTLALCRKHGVLEAELVRVIGFPSARLPLSKGSEGTVHSFDEVPEIGSPEDEAAPNEAITELAAHQARWNALDDQIGYSRMDRLIRESEAVERALLDETLLSPASTIDGMLAKLSVILCEAENRDDPEDFPWPHIRSLRNDLARLYGTEPATIARPSPQPNSESR